jgi:hypothetical protein
MPGAFRYAHARRIPFPVAPASWLFGMGEAQACSLQPGRPALSSLRNAAALIGEAVVPNEIRQ